jgi:hypothetical protein
LGRPFLPKNRGFKISAMKEELCDMFAECERSRVDSPKLVLGQAFSIL